jgi:glycosyltransferase involved in cell wall biosynthesis
MDAHAGQSMPFVSFIIVARNAAKHLINLLPDYLRQDYPIDLRELIIVEGGSEDDTKKVAQDFALQHPELAITILDNPKKTLAPGWNIALCAAKGDIVCRVDAHGAIPANYISTGVKLLQDLEPEKVVCVGGPLETKGTGVWGQAIAAVLSSPFGVGNSRFRYDKCQGYVDTVPFGFYWKWVFDQVGLFREDLGRTEDNELHARILNRGWRFFLSPQLETKYFCRPNISGLMKQAFGNGFWSIITWRQAAWRHLVPFFFIASVITLVVLSFFWWTPLYILLVSGVTYIILSYYCGYKSLSKTGDLSKIGFMPVVFFLLHSSYGLGSWWAVLSRQLARNT